MPRLVGHRTMASTLAFTGDLVEAKSLPIKPSPYIARPRTGD